MSQTQTRTTHLRIHPTPFRPTLLSIPPSPFSPLLPLTPPPPSKPTSSTSLHSTTISSPPLHPATSAPANPLSWMWQCHLCHRNYHLAATRRCLDDGHEFCSGTTTTKTARKSVRKVKRHRACASEFDYSGWKTWGRWRRSGRRSNVMSGGNKNGGIMKKKDCWNTCDYPSECRWGRKFGVHTPLTPSFPSPTHGTQTPPSPPLERAEEGILKPENCKGADQSGQSDFWSTLIASAKRRKSVTGSSPLTAEVSSSTPPSLLIDSDGDVEMSPSPTSPFLTSPNVGCVARDMLKDLMKRKTSLKRSNSDRQCPMLTVPKTVSMKEVEVGGADPEAMLDVEEFEPLERVQTRRGRDGV
jgi:hypothetical protein